MSFQQGSILIFCVFALAGAAACLYEARQRRKLGRMLRRLNSPYFRQVTDAYYRVGNLSGVGK